MLRVPQPARAKIRTVLAWSAFALSPITLGAWTAIDGPLDLVPTLAIALPFALLRRQPWAVLVLLLAELLLLHQNDSFIRYVQTFAVDVVVGYLAAVRRPRVSAGAMVVALATQLAVAAAFPVWPGYLRDTVTQHVLAMTSTWLIGNTIRLRWQYAKARRAQIQAEAVQVERLRIARELHDLVAHSIGVIAIQAGMGSRVIDTQPAEARNALRAIEDTSRDTLTGLRRMLGTLRRSDGESVTAEPGLSDLDTLVARSLELGLRVNFRWHGERRPLPPDIDLSAYRVIQEAVVNVVRHAGTDQCDVVVDQRDQELLIDVTDRGRSSVERGVEGKGYGIPGMRERIALLNGEFTAMPRVEGGFQVSARIPIPAAVQ
jgi:signal transduction histidine kinase